MFFTHRTRRSGAARAGVTPRLGVAAALLVSMPAAALAHGSPAASAGPSAGLPLAPVAHDRAAALAGEAGRIRALAAAAHAPDPQIARLVQFLEYQSFACLWLLVPGSVEDEDNPFNRCAHAYLAGVQALLARLEAGNADPDALKAIAERIAARQRERIPLCRFSAEGFGTGTIVSPDWSEVPRRPALLALLGGALLALAGLVWTVAEALRRLPRRPCDGDAAPAA